MAIYKNANLDISVAAEQNPNYNAKPSVQFSTQDKNTAKYTFTVKQNNKPVDLTGVTASVTLFSEDKSVFQSDANITNATEGKIEYVIPADAIRHHGKTRGDLRLTYPNGDVLGGLRFTFNIEQALIDRAAGVVGGVYIRDFETLKAEIQKTADSIKGIDVVRIDTKLNELEQRVEEGGVGVDEQARQEIQEVTAALAGTTSEISKLQYNPNGEGKQCVVSFLNDDCFDDHYGKLKPIFTNAGIPCSMALITKMANKMTKEHIMDLYSLGWDFGSHTVNHLSLLSLSEEEQDFELRESKKTIEEYGIPCDFIAYPYGDQNAITRKLVKKYYKFGFNTGANINSYPLETYNIRRVAVGAYYDRPTTEFPDTTSLDYYKGMFDKAYANKQYIVFMLHGYENDIQKQNIIDLIEYVQSHDDVPILTVSEAYERIGNTFTYGDPFNKNSEYFVASKTGAIMGSGIDNINSKLIPRTGITTNTPPSFFERGKTSICSFINSDNTGFPVANGGTLLTTRSETSIDLSYQLWYPFKSDHVYLRRMKDSVDWGNFVRISGQQFIDFTQTDRYDNSTPMTGFPENQITYTKLSSPIASSTSAPENKAGLLITNRLGSEAGYWYQEYHIYNSNKIYKRNWKSDGTWSTWNRTDGIVYKRLSVEIGSVPANSTKDVRVDVTGLNVSVEDSVVVSPSVSFPANCMMMGFYEGSYKVVLRVANLSGTAIDVGTKSITVTLLKTPSIY